MRYRPEVLDNNQMIIRNVETDIPSGSVDLYCVYDPRHPHSHTVEWCKVLNHKGDEIATIMRKYVPVVLKEAAVAVGSHEEYCGYPSLKGRRRSGRPDPKRVEHRLGTLLADAACEIARALVEYHNGDPKAETKSRCANLIAKIGSIWSASRFGSWDQERRAYDPYFANEPSWKPRMSFGDAAQHYGMNELRERFPDVSEAALKEALSWPLEVLGRTLKELMRPGSPDPTPEIPKYAVPRAMAELKSLFASASVKTQRPITHL
jgi:hypothetical protein